MSTPSLRNLSSILGRLKPFESNANNSAASALDRLEQAMSSTPQVERTPAAPPMQYPPSGYTVEDDSVDTVEAPPQRIDNRSEPAGEAAPAYVPPPPPEPVPPPTFESSEKLEEVAKQFSGPRDQPLNELRPPVPETMEHTGLSSKLIEQLIVKLIYYRGGMVGRELAEELGLQFSVIDVILDELKRNHHVTVKSSLGVGMISARFELSDSGRVIARDYIELNAYAGRAPVPLYQYVDIVRRQKQRDSWLTMDMLKEAYQHMVVTDLILNQIGPAVNSGKSFLIYGMPGNGKTFLAEALHHLDKSMIYIPYAIEHQGLIIQMFDPLYHTPEDTPISEILSITTESYDRRWFRSRRPFIVSGGELTLDALDLSYNATAKTYDAPLHMKANNGIYLVDDFGRQKVTPTEVLNRWIIPMERRIDFLTCQNGSKMHVPFEVFLVFSTNLKPDDLGDEAFLRRIQYKMLMRSPDEYEFAAIFKKYAESQGLSVTPKLIVDFLEKYYRNKKKPKRRCHPRDILTHAIDIIRFERRDWLLTQEVLDHAFESCFVAVDEEMS